MMQADNTARNFLLKNGGTSLAVVTMDLQGRPDSVSYWKNTAKSGTEPRRAKRHDNIYARGILMDIWV